MLLRASQLHPGPASFGPRLVHDKLPRYSRRPPEEPILPRALLAVWMPLLAVACARCPAPPVRPAPPPAPAALPIAVPTAAEPNADELAELVRAPGWEKADDTEVFRVEDPQHSKLRVLVADYEQARAEGDMQRRVRRFALFAPAPDEPGLTRVERSPWRSLDVVTVELSSGGADPLGEERRDIDGDGVADLLVHYNRRSLHQQPALGWVAVTSRHGRLIHAPLSHVVGQGHVFNGAACWLDVERRPVMFVEWFESDEERSLGRRAAAYVIDAAGLAAVRLYGVVAAESPELRPLVPLLGPEPEPPADPAESWVEKVRDCRLTPPGAVLAPLERGFGVLSGFSFRRESTGAAWPAALIRPGAARTVTLERLQGFAFPAATDIWR